MTTVEHARELRPGDAFTPAIERTFTYVSPTACVELEATIMHALALGLDLEVETLLTKADRLGPVKRVVTVRAYDRPDQSTLAAATMLNDRLDEVAS